MKIKYSSAVVIMLFIFILSCGSEKPKRVIKKHNVAILCDLTGSIDQSEVDQLANDASSIFIKQGIGSTISLYEVSDNEFQKPLFQMKIKRFGYKNSDKEELEQAKQDTSIAIRKLILETWNKNQNNPQHNSTQNTCIGASIENILRSFKNMDSEPVTHQIYILSDMLEHCRLNTLLSGAINKISEDELIEQLNEIEVGVNFPNVSIDVIYANDSGKEFSVNFSRNTFERFWRKYFVKFGISSDKIRFRTEFLE